MNSSYDDEDSDESRVTFLTLEKELLSRTNSEYESLPEEENGEINQNHRESRTDSCVRVDMGQTVLQWRRQRSQAEPDRCPEEAPSFLVVQENPIASATVSPTDIWDRNHQKQVSVRTETNRVHIELTATTNDNDSTPAKKLTKIAKIKPPPTGFVDCIAIWDTQKQAYLLQIPTFVAYDPVNTGVAVDEQDNKSLDFQKNDPLKRQLRAEAKLRKRKGGTSASALASKKSKRC